jgi:hypothetical protein
MQRMTHSNSFGCATAEQHGLGAATAAVDVAGSAGGAPAAPATVDVQQSPLLWGGQPIPPHDNESSDDRPASLHDSPVSPHVSLEELVRSKGGYLDGHLRHKFGSHVVPLESALESGMLPRVAAHGVQALHMRATLGAEVNLADDGQQAHHYT